ncbi:hypothetical protein MMC29_006097 [Sticta canariensis]|nr:hypothetical protein [Sticta canariensis]
MAKRQSRPVQTPRLSPQPTSQPARLGLARDARNLKARTINIGLSGVPPTAAVILPINALQVHIRLNQQQDW